MASVWAYCRVSTQKEEQEDSLEIQQRRSRATVLNLTSAASTAARVATAIGMSAETRAGAIDISIPKLRKGSYVHGFLEPRRTAEKALVASCNKRISKESRRDLSMRSSKRWA